MADIFRTLYNFVAACTWLGVVIEWQLVFGETILGRMIWSLVIQIEVDVINCDWHWITL